MKRRGNSLLETALWIPVLMLLLVGMVQLARITYTYYTLQKTLYTMARYIGTQQGANLCDAGDAVIASAKNYALTGSTDSSASPTLTGLTAEMIQVQAERYSGDSDTLGSCECSITGCDTGAGGRPPDFIVVSIPDGYPFPVSFPYLSPEIIFFRPSVRVPYGGT